MTAQMPGEALTVDVTVDADVPVPSGIDGASIASLAEFALAEEAATGSWEVSFLFTSDDAIQRMHLEFMDLDSPTDIMTFPYESDDFMPGAIGGRGGDVVISVDTARENATDAGWTLADELQFLVLHGILHLLGWDDPDAEQRAEMLARQSVLLDGWRNQ